MKIKEKIEEYLYESNKGVIRIDDFEYDEVSKFSEIKYYIKEYYRINNFRIGTSKDVENADNLLQSKKEIEKHLKRGDTIFSSLFDDYPFNENVVFFSLNEKYLNKIIRKLSADA